MRLATRWLGVPRLGGSFAKLPQRLHCVDARTRRRGLDLTGERRGFNRGSAALLGASEIKPEVRGGCAVSNKTESKNNSLDWGCRHTWKRSAVNTSWCLLGCSIGEFGALLAFQEMGITHVSVATVTVPVLAGLATSVSLETGILKWSNSSMALKECFDTAMRMSFLSMCAMELAMEGTDFALNFFVNGSPSLTMQWWSVAPMLIAGFAVPLPYNYYRLKKFNLACH